MQLTDPDFGPVGIMGAGHLGGTLATELLRHGLPPARLLLSTSGSADGLRRVRERGLSAHLAPNERVAACPLVLVALRPRGWRLISELAFAADTLLVSTVAGVSAADMAAVTGRPCVHAMPCGPDTIRAGLGICALYPADPRAKALMAGIGLRCIPLGSEEEMRAFTAALCLPAAAVAAQSLGVDLTAQWDAACHDYPALAETIRWARSVVPALSTEAERERYVSTMATRGGITEVVVQGIRAGESLGAALARGMERCAEIAAGE